MQLSIRDASRFMIGAAMMRAKAIEASGNTGITFDNVALAALRKGPDGEKIRQSIETLADQESSWMRNTPPHTLRTARVMQSRQAEIKAYSAIHGAVVATVELVERASKGDSEAKQRLQVKYIEAFRAIEETPGSTQDRRKLKSALRSEATSISAESNFVAETLIASETAYLEADADAILSHYDTLDSRSSNDFEP